MPSYTCAAECWTLHGKVATCRMKLVLDTSIVIVIVQDLRQSVQALRDDPNALGAEGKAPVYGMANINPDRSMVGEILVAVQDSLLD